MAQTITKPVEIAPGVFVELGGTEESRQRLLESYQRRCRENDARIDAGEVGDVPDPLTEEEEERLARAWATQRAEEEQETEAESESFSSARVA